MPRRRSHMLVAVPVLLFLYIAYVRFYSTSSSDSPMVPKSPVIRGLEVNVEEATFVLRQRYVEEVCSAKPEYNWSTADFGFRKLAQNPELLTNILVSDRHKVLYCYVPKVACTNWKRVMLLLNSNNVTDFSQIPSDSVHRKNVFMKLSDLPPDEILHRLKTYNKFLFVRHPIERVLSAFRNKFEKNYTSSAYFKERFGVAILKKYRPNEDFSAKGDGVRFSEFVQYMMDIFDKDPTKLNEHWAPFSQLCQPCDVRYNLVGKYESLESDAEFILHEIDAPKEVRFPPVVQSKTSSFVDSYVSTLSDDQFAGLKKIYEDDFKLFDYEYRRA